MLYEVLGDIWVVQRNPYLQDDLLDNPSADACWSMRWPPPGRDRKAPHAETIRIARRHGGGRVAGGRPRRGAGV